MMNFVLKTRNCVSKTRNCVLKMMDLSRLTGGVFKVVLKLDTSPNPVHQPWNNLLRSMTSSCKLRFDVVTAKKLRLEREQSEQLEATVRAGQRKRDWAAWKETEAAVIASVVYIYSCLYIQLFIYTVVYTKERRTTNDVLKSGF